MLRILAIDQRLREHLAAQVDKKSYIVTDESNVYVTAGKDYSGHASVNHSKGEYVRLGGLSTPPRASTRSSSAGCTARIRP
jgi:hypothetical protein